MKKLLLSVCIIVTLFSFNSCNFIYSFSNYKSTTEAFTNNLLNRNFDQCVKLMAMDNAPKDFNLNDFKIGLDTFRSVIVRNFGTKLEYSFLKAEKHLSFGTKHENDDLPPNSTLTLIEFRNSKSIGILQVLFDDKSHKILNIKTLDVKQPIPDMSKFWLFGLFPIIVVILNIYTIIRVKRSDVRLKWLYYIGIVLLNVPTIQYNAVDGMYFRPLYFQILLGFGIEKSGYLGAIWQVGIPLGAIIANWRLNTRRPEVTPDLLAEQYSGGSQQTPFAADDPQPGE